MPVDHYNTLGVIPTASAADLRTAYLKLARANHPDKFVGANRETAEARMQQINEAWNVLGVSHKRREYDATLPASQSSRSAAGRHNTHGSNSHRGHADFRPFDPDGADWDPNDRSNIDWDTTPIAGSKKVPRWMAFVPVALFVFGVVIMALGTMVNAAGVFALGIVALGLGGVCFLMLPLFVMSRAERDPEL